MVFYNNELITSKLDNISRLTETHTKYDISKFINLLSERIVQMESIFVVDRIEGKYAICENRNTGEMSEIEVSQLPQDIKEGSVLKLENGKYVIDDKTKEEIQDRITDKMNRLWNK